MRKKKELSAEIQDNSFWIGGEQPEKAKKSFRSLKNMP